MNVSLCESCSLGTEVVSGKGSRFCRRRSKNVAPGKNRRGGRIAERTFVQTLGPEQNGDFSPVLSGSSEAPECTPTWRCGVRFAAEY